MNDETKAFLVWAHKHNVHVVVFYRDDLQQFAATCADTLAVTNEEKHSYSASCPTQYADTTDAALEALEDYLRGKRLIVKRIMEVDVPAWSEGSQAAPETDG